MNDDLALLRAWRLGDTGAGSALLRRYVDIVYHFFLGKVDAETADELTQRVFEAGVAARDRVAVEPGQSLRGYLLGIARNKLLQYHDEWRRRGSRVEDEAPEQVTDLSLSSVVAQDERQRLILRAIRGLPIDYQIVIELFYWEDLSVEEIGQVLGVPGGTIKSRMSRARVQLKRRLERMALSTPLAGATVHRLEDWILSMRRRVQEQGAG